MRNPERRVAMLVLKNGKCPLEDWLDTLRDKPTRARIERQIDKLSRTLGNQKGLHGISEMRPDFGPGYRIYYGETEPGVIVVLLGGGDKSSQRKDIALARKLWDEFQHSLTGTALRLWSNTEED